MEEFEKERLLPSEAVFGFVVWLTNREEKVVLSKSDDVAPVVDLIRKFCKANNLVDPRNDWSNYLNFPKEEGS